MSCFFEKINKIDKTSKTDKEKMRRLKLLISGVKQDITTDTIMKRIIMKYSWPLNNMGVGGLTLCTVKNLLITFDFPKT